MAAAASPKWVQPTVDYGGLLIFAGTYAVTRDMMAASWGLAIGSAAALLLGFIVEKRLALLPLLTGISAILFASLALIFHDAIFIKMKLTIVDSILAVLLLGGLALGKVPLKAVLGSTLKLSDAAWRTLTLRYGLFFVFLAASNAFVVLNPKMFSDDVWVAFRFPGVPIMALVFSLFQAPLFMRELKNQEELDKVAPPPAD